ARTVDALMVAEISSKAITRGHVGLGLPFQRILVRRRYQCPDLVVARPGPLRSPVSRQGRELLAARDRGSHGVNGEAKAGQALQMFAPDMDVVRQPVFVGHGIAAQLVDHSPDAGMPRAEATCGPRLALRSASSLAASVLSTG